MAMKQMNTIVLFVVAAGMLLCAVGCGRVDRSDQVVIWEQMDPVEQTLLDQHIEEFLAAHPEYADFTITHVHYTPEDVRTQFQTAAMAFGGPNLVYGPSDQIGPFSIMGLIEPLDGIFSEDELARFDPAGLPSLDGHIWGLPDQVGNHLTLVANLDLVTDIPDNTDAWLAQLAALTIDEDGDGKPEQYGLVFNMAEPFWLMPWLGGFGGWVMDDNGDPTLDTEAMVGALAFLDALKKSGVVPRECDYPLADTLFKQGNAAYIINGPWSWQGYREAGRSIRLAPLPRVSATGLWPSPMTAAKCYAVNRYLDPDARACTLDLLRWLTGPKVQADLAQTMGVLPADLEVRERPELLADELMAASRVQIDKGRFMPIVPEMRFIWDAMRPYYQSVLNNEITPAHAAQGMQEQASREIARERE
jgi:arabinogalactan oligomer / maltooligosaccharide transport system substrate-binding protein